MGLSVHNLSKNYGPKAALQDISLEMQPGEIIGLLGPNGAGKSTLMKTLAGALAVQQGQVRLEDLTTAENPVAYKKNIGFLPENNPLPGDMYVREYLRFLAEIHRLKDKNIVEDTLEMLGILPEADKKIRQLSKGYQQRVGLAQAVMHRPALMILDEPTNGLDPNQILDIRGVIKKLGTGRMVLLSTHIMQEVEALCSRVILIHQGKILTDCPMAEFRGKFGSLEEAFAAHTATPV